MDAKNRMAIVCSLMNEFWWETYILWRWKIRWGRWISIVLMLYDFILYFREENCEVNGCLFESILGYWCAPEHFLVPHAFRDYGLNWRLPCAVSPTCYASWKASYYNQLVQLILTVLHFQFCYPIFYLFYNLGSLKLFNIII